MQVEGLKVRTVLGTVLGMLEKGPSSLCSTLPSPGVFGPLAQGTRTPEITFLLVEGQQGVRIRKGNTSAHYLRQEGP